MFQLKEKVNQRIREIEPNIEHCKDKRKKKKEIYECGRSRQQQHYSNLNQYTNK